MTAGLGGEAVRASVALLHDLLDRAPDGSSPEPVMGVPVVAVAEHVGACLAWYAHDLVAGTAEAWPANLVPRPDAGLGVLAATVSAWGEVLARTVDASPMSERGWHPHGLPDAAGFAAMGCAEVLVHGNDIADALSLGWSPPAGVAGAVLTRLFPEVPEEPDPMVALLWATGRIDLPGRPRRSSWSYAAAPEGERS